MDARLDLVRQWLARADRDLEAARIIRGQGTPYLDIAAFHCQQAAEKAIKGLLVLNDTRFTKTHDLVALIEQADPFLPGLLRFVPRAGRLSPFGAEERYPGDLELTDAADYEALESVAYEIYESVLQVVPPEARPQGPS
jgi:HEPN domain-containing protein